MRTGTHTHDREFGTHTISAAPIALYLVAMLLADPARTVSLAVPAAYFVLITVLRDRPTTANDADDFS